MTEDMRIIGEEAYRAAKELLDAAHIRRCRFMCCDGEIFAEYLRLRPMIVEGSEKR